VNPEHDDLAHYRLSAEENERVFREEIVPLRLARFEPQDQPLLIVLMAQPGAGKSAHAARIRAELASEGGVVEIDSDLYKPFHPDYHELMATDDQLMAAATRADGRAWMARVQQYVREHRLNAVFHETAQDPQESLDTLAAYRAADYRIAVLALGVHESQSLQGVLHRYQEQVNERGAGRLTVAENAERSYRGIVDTARLIDERQAADVVAVYRRTVDEQGPAYVNELDERGAWRRPPGFAHAIEIERHRPLDAEEIRNYEVVQDQLRTTLAEDLRPRLHHVEQLAADLLTPSAERLAAYQAPELLRQNNRDLTHPAVAVRRLHRPPTTGRPPRRPSTGPDTATAPSPTAAQRRRGPGPTR